MLEFLKDNLGVLVGPKIGRHLRGAPYLLGLGLKYHQIKAKVRTPIDEKEYFKKLFSLVHYAYETLPFYRNFYDAKGFKPKSLVSKSDWHNVPIVTKADFKLWSVEKRSIGKRYLSINTGGTSGQPLDFRVPRDAFSYEWAHMHSIWHSRGYKFGELKVTFRGKHFGKSVLKYNAVHHEFLVNASAKMSDVVGEVLELSKSMKISWLHGYPSLVAEFATEISKINNCESRNLLNNLNGVLLGSEFPAPAYRDKIKLHLSTNILTWYGHSEMSVIAKESEAGVYYSLPTYGYAESLPVKGQSSQRLIATSLFNKIHPFIRYDTGDLIEPVNSNAASLSFKIKSGRVGDFITDKNNQRHSLTAVIFGRHHEIFSYVDHVQIQQNIPGTANLILSGLSPTINKRRILQLFDLRNLNIEFNIIVVKEPIRTKAGKILLKIQANAELKHEGIVEAPTKKLSD